MKWFTFLFACFSLAAFANEIRDNRDLTQFDQPFLLGDWYLVNPNPEQSEENFLAIKLSLDSNYSFKIDIQKRDYSVDHWEGGYAANDDTLILGVNTSEPQIYDYSSNHNMLNLNGVTFTKALSNSLAGMWSSDQLGGEDIVHSKVQQVDLILQPDFVFMFRVSNDQGDEAVHKGVYYTEGEHLVLLYEHGEHETKYSLNSDILTLEMEEGSMYAVLNRVR
ncbi:hypothetical protein ACODM8_14625 [Vibrio ostreicida]|uniref:WD40 repeat protein n=1 Tax=Vibrio ostreicida TaxID=526588 RepID=A0ABT8BVF1_9VIBR|nr:hypothetical protein [Vibrio ostreicida]MDN3610073.1 hypothetical protein [Vibrio ostreicida]NPD10057.1 hypothetical protein [Vibrio ostreicida]